MQKHFAVFWVTHATKCVLCWILIKKISSRISLNISITHVLVCLWVFRKSTKIYEFFLLNSSIRDYVEFSWKQTLSWWIKFFVLSHNLFQLISNRFSFSVVRVRNFDVTKYRKMFKNLLSTSLVLELNRQEQLFEPY